MRRTILQCDACGKDRAGTSKEGEGGRIHLHVSDVKISPSAAGSSWSGGTHSSPKIRFKADLCYDCRDKITKSIKKLIPFATKENECDRNCHW